MKQLSCIALRNCLYRFRGRFCRSKKTPQRYSTEYRLLEESDLMNLEGWRTDQVAQRQHNAFAGLVKAAHEGNPRLDFTASAQAIAATGLANLSLLEVGCGSGYYSEVLPLLLKRPINYMGLDYSQNMTELGHQTYAEIPFVTGDATALPFADASFDVILSGASLMHIPNYTTAIREAVRVSRRWCVFHTVPVMANRSTTLLTKRAYGQPVAEVIFNQSELTELFGKQGLEICQVYKNIPYDVSAIVGDKTWNVTFLCRKI